MGQEKYRNGFEVTLHPECLNEPLEWKTPCTVFVCSMSDIFHEDVPLEFIDKIMQVIRDTPQHTYQILTKRAERMNRYFQNIREPKNMWIGVTVENADARRRINYLRGTGATIKFLSCEPLVEDLGDINLDYIDWVIVGGETGVKARPMKEEWVLNIQRQCQRQGVAFFFKQWGTWGADGVRRSKKENGCLLNGREWKDIPSKKQKYEIPTDKSYQWRLHSRIRRERIQGGYGRRIYRRGSEGTPE